MVTPVVGVGPLGVTVGVLEGVGVPCSPTIVGLGCPPLAGVDVAVAPPIIVGAGVLVSKSCPVVGVGVKTIPGVIDATDVAVIVISWSNPGAACSVPALVAIASAAALVGLTCTPVFGTPTSLVPAAPGAAVPPRSSSPCGNVAVPVSLPDAHPAIKTILNNIRVTTDLRVTVRICLLVFMFSPFSYRY